MNLIKAVVFGLLIGVGGLFIKEAVSLYAALIWGALVFLSRTYNGSHSVMDSTQAS